MHVAGQLALVAIIAFGINLIPAFGPPTWALLVFLELQWDVNSVGLVLAGAIGLEVSERDRQHAAFLRFEDAEGRGEFRERRERIDAHLEREARGVLERAARGAPLNL